MFTSTSEMQSMVGGCKLRVKGANNDADIFLSGEMSDFQSPHGWCIDIS